MILAGHQGAVDALISSALAVLAAPHLTLTLALALTRTLTLARPLTLTLTLTLTR